MTLSRRGVFQAAGVAAATAAGLAVGGDAALAAGADGIRPGGRGRRLRTGADVAAADRWRMFSGRKVGVITNPTGVLEDFTSIVDDMVAAGVDVAAVFGPEHGFRGTAQAGEAEETFVDPRTGVTVYDAYGATVAKLSGFFSESGVDTVVFDIRDVGVRFYTYIWTMWTAMQAAAQAGGLRFVVLDRPNPLGGKARGPVLQQGYTSGVGLLEISQQHGMTVGELALYFNAAFMRRAGQPTLDDLQVVKVEGWRREMVGPDQADRWIPPSPNMPTPQTATLYPGTGMVEATDWSEGRGTTRPFELIGAPYLDHRWAAALNEKRLAGVEFREAYFTPTFSKNAGQVCAGVQIHIMDAEKVDAIAVATHMLVEARRLYDDFAWRGDGGRWIGLLTGSGRFQQQLEAGASAEGIIAAWQPELKRFVDDTRPYLLYRGPRR
ncbi:exo-beta-N-acetylmuramidase NamZ domain-containing protein [Microbacterium sp. NPDC058345]|uniref:exo-beta-N-acetylmuramidase NamZ family protein n=1 Tax=Microbacterium sp. NPDC058345 TaxID=3346455 RepID=UPI0036650702